MTVLKAELAPHVARVLTLRAHNVDAPTALAYGLLDELQPSARVLSAAIDVARDFAAIPRDAYTRIKRQVRAAAIAEIDDMLARGSDPLLEAWFSAEAPAASAAPLRGGKEG